MCCDAPIIVQGSRVARAKFFERQADACAALAQETEDSDCRERCLRLQQIYLHLAESENGPILQQGMDREEPRF
jgi:hypothetical protein